MTTKEFAGGPGPDRVPEDNRFSAYQSFYDDAKKLFPWLPDELLKIYASAWADSGDPDLALATIRQSDAYLTYFAGNRREDGTIRMSEFDYASTIDAYKDIFRSVNLNPSLFQDMFVLWIEGDVSPNEVWEERVQPMVERVLDVSPQIRAYYADTYGLQLTDAAILASVLDPNLGERVINQQISIAEIGGEAAVRNFDITSGYADALLRQGVNRQTAQELFGKAADELPVLDVLAQRHNDPDDDFDIYEFTNAAIFDDPTQRSRIRSLVAQERQLFSQAVGLGQLHKQDQLGRDTGLKVR